MKKLKITIKALNMLFISVLLFFFYLLIIPLGRVIFVIVNTFEKKNKKSYWVPIPKNDMDLSSPY